MSRSAVASVGHLKRVIRIKIWPLLVLGITFPGCARFTPQPISPQENAARFEHRSLADESLHRYVESNLHRVFSVWPPESWDLEILTLAAFYFNPDLAVARATYDSTSAAKITAGQRPNPTVNVSPAYNSITAIPSPWLVTATLDVPIEMAGKRGYRRAQAAHASDAARFALATSAWDVRLRLRRTLVDLWSAERAESLLLKQNQAQQTIVRLLEMEVAVGGIAPTEVSRERIALQQTKLSRLDAENRRVQARTQLAEVIGVSASALDNIVISFSSFEMPPAELSPAEARNRALLNRTDVLGALADYAVSESALQLEIARQYPDLHLNPGYEFDQGDHKWGVGVSFELPVLNQNRGPIAEAEARRRESAARFNALQARVIGDIDSALAGYRNAAQKLAVATEVLAQEQNQARVTEKMAEAGELSTHAVAAARLETTNGELAQLDALLKLQQAAAILENVLQLPLDLPASLINGPAQVKSHP